MPWADIRGPVTSVQNGENDLSAPRTQAAGPSTLAGASCWLVGQMDGRLEFQGVTGFFKLLQNNVRTNPIERIVATNTVNKTSSSKYRKCVFGLSKLTEVRV